MLVASWVRLLIRERFLDATEGAAQLVIVGSIVVDVVVVDVDVAVPVVMVIILLDILGSDCQTDDRDAEVGFLDGENPYPV